VKNSSFDLDFSYGRVGETLVDELLTNNVYIEVRCWYNNSQSWEPSGLSVSEASYWAFVLESSVFIIPTQVLRSAVPKYGREITCEIPPNKSTGYLIRIEDLLSETKEHRSL
jgi:hypothetical protein